MVPTLWLKEGDRVNDETGRSHVLGTPLVTGRRAALYAVADSAVGLKVCRPQEPWQDDWHRQRLAALTVRARTGGLRIDGLIFPEALLAEPHVGFVFPLPPTDNQTPLPGLIRLGATKLPTHEPALNLRRRLRIAARLARLFEQVDRAGLCFRDFSPAHILTYADVERDQLSVLDADNLVPQGEAPMAPWAESAFAAPELQQPYRSPNRYSDRWSFAVLLHLLLVWRWPGQPDDQGLPTGKTLTRALQRLLALALEAGRADPLARPAPSEWRAALDLAADRTGLCRACKGTTYLRGTGVEFTCDWCGATARWPHELRLTMPRPDFPWMGEQERAVLKRISERRRIFLDSFQRFVPLRLITGDPEAEGAGAQFGTRKVPGGDRSYGLVNLTGEAWQVCYATGAAQQVLPGTKVFDVHRGRIEFPSGVVAEFYSARGSDV